MADDVAAPIATGDTDLLNANLKVFCLDCLKAQKPPAPAIPTKISIGETHHETRRALVFVEMVVAFSDAPTVAEPYLLLPRNLGSLANLTGSLAHTSYST
jgi:hypothetical protein